jgi:crotonobetainyl-CoA:carnitine CoA-transferase CaiB-like acyl-CoA transferase
VARNERVLGEPVMPMVFADHVVGLIAAQCILAAPLSRERTGEGRPSKCRCSEMAAFVLAQHHGDRTFVPPLGESGDRRVLHPLAKPIKTKDRCLHLRQYRCASVCLFEAIGRPELKSGRAFARSGRGTTTCVNIAR